MALYVYLPPTPLTIDERIAETVGEWDLNPLEILLREEAERMEYEEVELPRFYQRQ